jgi:hypothetical protein
MMPSKAGYCTCTVILLLLLLLPECQGSGPTLAFESGCRAVHALQQHCNDYGRLQGLSQKDKKGYDAEIVLESHGAAVCRVQLLLPCQKQKGPETPQAPAVHNHPARVSVNVAIVL